MEPGNKFFLTMLDWDYILRFGIIPRTRQNRWVWGQWVRPLSSGSPYISPIANLQFWTTLRAYWTQCPRKISSSLALRIVTISMPTYILCSAHSLGPMLATNSFCFYSHMGLVLNSTSWIVIIRFINLWILYFIFFTLCLHSSCYACFWNSEIRWIFYLVLILYYPLNFWPSIRSY